MPKLSRMLETALYETDLDKAAAFYADVMGLPCIHADHRMRAYDVGGNGVLLLFREGQRQLKQAASIGEKASVVSLAS